MVVPATNIFLGHVLHPQTVELNLKCFVISLVLDFFVRPCSHVCNDLEDRK